MRGPSRREYRRLSCFANLALAGIGAAALDDEMLEDLEFYSWIDFDDEADTTLQPEDKVG